MKTHKNKSPSVSNWNFGCSQCHLQNKAITVQTFSSSVYILSHPPLTPLSCVNDLMFVEKGTHWLSSTEIRDALTTPLIDSISHSDWLLEGPSLNTLSKSMKILLQHFALRDPLASICPFGYHFIQKPTVWRLLHFQKWIKWLSTKNKIHEWW